MTINDYPYVFKILDEAYQHSQSPSVTLIANTSHDVFKVLISTIISLRTKDEVTLQVTDRLFKIINSFIDIQAIPLSELEKNLYPAGFYKTKAKNLKKMAEIILNEWQGKIPDQMESLLQLPGVGRKTANLVLSLGFKQLALCVDTHVHRITNRFGWVKTKTPQETEFALRQKLPNKYWQKINDYLVSYGQSICRPISPYCSKCQLDSICPKINVKSWR